MQATTVREALRASLAGTFGTVLSVLPRIIVFAIALAIGWAVSSLLARATVAALRAVRFDEMARRSGLARFIENMGVEQDPTGVVASVSKWVVRLLTLVVALDVLGLPAGSGVLHQMLLWLPNLAVALVALVIGGVAATALSRLVRGFTAGAGLPNPRVLAAATSVAVWAFAVVAAVSQLGIATSVVNLGLVGVVGAIALATGLAFGWAGRERAAQLLLLLDDWRAVPSSQAEPTSSSAAAPTAPSASASLPASVVSSPVAQPESALSDSSPASPALDQAPSLDISAHGITASAPELESPGPELESSGLELESHAPELESSTAEFESSTGEFESSIAEFESPRARFESPTAEFESPRPEFDSVAPEFDGPEFDASARGFDGSVPGLDAPVPEHDESVPGLHASAPEFDASVPEFDPLAPEFDHSAPQSGRFVPESDDSAPQLDAFVSEHVASALEPEPLPPDESTFGPERVVPFEESWVPRSGVDRRRIPRPGPDRRASIA